jgi:hypothetical protein
VSPALQVQTLVPAPVADVLATSLDLDVEVAAGRRFGVHPVPGGPGSRTSGRIELNETVTWAMRLFGILPVRHTSRITAVEDRRPDGGARFVDEMVRGLFARFHHEHVLHPVTVPSAGTGSGEGATEATLMVDAMSWTSPLGPLGRIADAAFVERILRGLLADRNAEIVRRLAARAADA